MSTQPHLNEDWDIHLDSNGDLAMASDGEQVIQHVTQNLRLNRGEWAYGLSLGVPWKTEILGQRFSSGDSQQAYAESYIREAIVGTPEVTRLLSFSMTEANRITSWSFRFDTAYGDFGTDYFNL